MIILIDNDFKIIQSEFGFDLLRFIEGKRKGEGSIVNPTGETYIKESLVGYYTNLENIIEKIIHLRLSDKEEVATLKEYLEIYREQVNRIEKIIKSKD
jgi:hypothetical protein